MAVYHILNGDALNDVFPDQIIGERIVAREALVDGEVSGETPEALYTSRSKFFSENYTDCQAADYEKKSIIEFKRIQSIPTNAEVNLWFEDDLFCQVNLWFVIHLLCAIDKNHSIYLIRPTACLQFGFGGMDSVELNEAFHSRKEIPPSDLAVWKLMWKHYQQSNTTAMLQIAGNFSEHYPFLLLAVKAHIGRLSVDGKVGRPERVIIQIMEDLKTKDFRLIFREFCKREPIYGFGDLQVERIWKKVIER